MHACGHDIHITNLIGTARWFAAHKDQWKGTLMFLGQPAEERDRRGEGDARRRPVHAVPQARLLPSPCTVRRTWRPARSASRRGYALANTDSVDITHDRQGRPRGVSAHDDRPDRDGGPARPRLADDRQPRDSSRSSRAWSRSARSTAARSTTSSATNATCSSRCGATPTRSAQQMHDAIVRKAKAVAAGAGAPEPKVAFTEGHAGDVQRREAGRPAARGLRARAGQGERR